MNEAVINNVRLDHLETYRGKAFQGEVVGSLIDTSLQLLYSFKISLRLREVCVSSPLLPNPVQNLHSKLISGEEIKE